MRGCALSTSSNRQSAFTGGLAHPAQKPAFTEPRAEQQSERFLILELRHIEAEEAAGAEEMIREYDGNLGFSNTCRAEEKKTSARPPGFAKAEFAAL
jgi:hypothetical protein